MESKEVASARSQPSMVGSARTETFGGKHTAVSLMGDLGKAAHDVNVVEVVCKRLASLAAKNEGEWTLGA